MASGGNVELSNILAKWYEDQESSLMDISDFVLVGVNGQEYNVHRLVLSISSLHFRETIFAHPENKECTSGKYVFSEAIDPLNLLEHVIKYMYTGEIDFTPTTSVAYYKIADFLVMANLQKEVREYIYNTDLASFADDDFLFLPLEFLTEWLSSDHLKVRDENTVYEKVASLLTIVPQSLEKQPEFVGKIMQCIRFCLMSNDSLRKAQDNPLVPKELMVKHLLTCREASKHECCPRRNSFTLFRPPVVDPFERVISSRGRVHRR